MHSKASACASELLPHAASSRFDPFTVLKAAVDGHANMLNVRTASLQAAQDVSKPRQPHLTQAEASSSGRSAEYASGRNRCQIYRHRTIHIQVQTGMMQRPLCAFMKLSSMLSRNIVASTGRLLCVPPQHNRATLPQCGLIQWRYTQQLP